MTDPSNWTLIIQIIIGVLVPTILVQWGFKRVDNKDVMNKLVQQALDNQRRDINIQQNRDELNEHKIFCDKKADSDKQEFATIRKGIADIHKMLS